MGCGPSKIDQEETVARCKDRKRFTREAVVARNGLAAAHSAYAFSLKNTGAALSDYAQGESAISDIHRGHHTKAITSSSGTPVANPPADNIPAPPPPPESSEMMSSLQRSSSAPVVAVLKNKGKRPMNASITEEEDGDEPGLGSVPSEVMHEESVLPPPLPEHESKGMETEEYLFQDTMQEYPYKPENETPHQPSPPMPPPPPPPPAKSYWNKKGNAVTLLHVLNQLDDHFLKASASAHDVLKRLEAVQMHYHSNFADNRGYIDHSARVLNAITWNRSSFREASENGEAKEDFDKDEWETHATVLDKIFAWEKKLYEEVKEVEIMKMAYNEKLISLNKKKRRGVSSGSIERTKSVASHLHTKYVVATQTMESTLSEIDRLRDSQLYPKLVDLVEGLWRMWEAMFEHHKMQLKMIASLRNFDITATIKETSEQHRDRTIQLWEMVREWHVQFHKLTNYQREYINALTNWVVLNLIPTDTDVKKKPRHQEPEAPSQEPEVSGEQQEPLPIEKLLRGWSACLEKLQDEAAGSAIFTFSEVIRNIITLQDDELKLKQNCERLRKELEKKRRQFEDWRYRYMEKQYSRKEPSGYPEGSGPDPLAERQALVEALEKSLEEEETRYRDHCKHVRENSIISFRTKLPELFRAMLEFSLGSSIMYKELLSSTQPLEEGNQ